MQVFLKTLSVPFTSRTPYRMKRISICSAFFVFWFAVTSAVEISGREDAYRENIRKLTLANNELAFNLHRKLVSESSENVFFSSLRFSMVFCMLFYGARGNTAEELRKTLGYEKADLPNNLVYDTFNSYLKEVLRRVDSSDGYLLNDVNALLIDNKLGLYVEYTSDVQEFYGATVLQVNFSGKSSVLVKRLNEYIGRMMNWKIDKVMDKLDEPIVLILLNAVHFEGIWENKFEPKLTTDDIFFNKGLESERRRVPFMHLRSEIPYASVDNFQAIELPYKGGNVSMLILLPKQRDGLQDLEKTLTPEKLGYIQRLFNITTVDVSLPKFNLDFQKELSAEVHALGAKQIFENEADFTGMNPVDILKVGAVLHKAVIKVSETGSADASRQSLNAGWMSGTRPASIPPPFLANHPFLFAILEKSCNMILFLGRVNNL